MSRSTPAATASAAGPGGVLTSFRMGIQELTDATAAGFGTVRTGAAVTELRPCEGGFDLFLGNGESMTAEVVISASPLQISCVEPPPSSIITRLAPKL